MVPVILGPDFKDSVEIARVLRPGNMCPCPQSRQSTVAGVVSGADSIRDGVGSSISKNGILIVKILTLLCSFSFPQSCSCLPLL